MGVTVIQTRLQPLFGASNAINPSFEPHRRLEREVIAYLGEQGFVVHSSTYHDIMPNDLQNILRLRFTPTALYLRARADRIAIHRHVPVEFEIECKAHESTMWSDMTIEALPLLHHMSKSKLGVRCLYCYHNPNDDSHRGFWVDSIPAIRQINIPEARTTSHLWEWFTVTLQEGFKVRPRRTEHRRGSGDPYLIIDKSVVATLPTWQSLVDATLPPDPWDRPWDNVTMTAVPTFA